MLKLDYIAQYEIIRFVLDRQDNLIAEWKKRMFKEMYDLEEELFL